MVSKDSLAQKYFQDSETAFNLRQLIKDYEDHKRAISSHLSSAGNEDSGKSSVIVTIINAVMSLFSKKETEVSETEVKPATKTVKPSPRKKGKNIISHTTRDIYKQIKNKSSKLIAVSDLIEIKPDNETKIDQIITELRQNNLKIVIPIYNARKVLYPGRSKKYLTADVEYLLVDTDIPASPDSIRIFTDSLAGYKFKEDTISSSALFTIEKYLMTIYRQNRAKTKRAKNSK